LTAGLIGSAATLEGVAAATPATDAAAPAVAGLHQARARFERMPVARLKYFYRACSETALERPIGPGDAALCSIAYDVVLRNHFSGDFHALYAWSRVAR
jgi:hypothetical protein